MGAGWTHSYESRLVRDLCGRFTIIGGEGTGIFNQTGGRHTVGKALTIASAYQFGCAYNLSAGTLSALELLGKP